MAAMFGGTPDPMSMLLGIMGAPQGQKAALDIASTLAVPAKAAAKMFRQHAPTPDMVISYPEYQNSYMESSPMARFTPVDPASQFYENAAMGFVGSVGPKFQLSARGNRTIQANVGERNAGTINLAGDHPYVSSVFVEPEFRGIGIGRALYEEAEKLQGRKLVPSPLGLSDQAKRVWRKRLAEMPPEQAQSLIAEAWDIGRSYGIKDEHIGMRLNDLLPPMFGKKP